METHYDLTDSELEKQFEECSLDPGYFNHEAHLRLAWIHIKLYGVEQASRNLVKQILNFAESARDSKKFNKTLTIAAVKVVNHFAQKSSSDTFRGFITLVSG